MEQNAQRELLAANPEWSVRELMSRLAEALASQGPALSLGQSATRIVDGDISLVVATTGSSGVAKEVGLSAAALVSSAQGSNKFLGASAGDTWSLLLPATHIAGINVLIRCLELGTEPVDLRKHQGPYPQVSFTAIVPTHLFRALKADSNLLKHLVDAKAVLVGGAALSDALRKEATAAGINIVTTYGMTETCGGCIYNGQALSGVEVKIIEDFSEFEAEFVETEDLDVSDTLTLLTQYVDAIETDIDKERLKNLMKTLYIEAQNQE